jgi:hypothetical protein
MSAVNDITGDAIKTKPASETYRNNFDAIFRKPVVESSYQPQTKEENEDQKSTD